MWTECYGWGDQSHVGLKLFMSAESGMCIEAPDCNDYPDVFPYTLTFAVIHRPTSEHRHRDIEVYRDGILKDRYEVPDSYIWAYMDVSVQYKDHEKPTRFLLIDRDTHEIIFSRLIFWDFVEEEEVVPPPDIVEGVDYARIRDDTVNVVHDSTVIATLEHVAIIDGIDDVSVDLDALSSSLNTTGFNIINEVRGQMGLFVARLDSVKDSITSPIDSILTYLNDVILSRLNNLQFTTDNMFDVLDIKISRLDFPTLTSIKDAFRAMAADIAIEIINRVWDEIERRYKE